MREDIRSFYEKTMLEAVSPDPQEAPAAYVHVFHKAYPRFPSTELTETSSTLDELLEKRHSTRTFSDKPLSFKDLSAVLRSCRVTDPKRDPERRTYPSAGARFPIEPYLIALRTENLSPGAYHYNIPAQSVEQLWKRDLSAQAQRFCSPYIPNPAAAIVLAAAIPRAEIKYGAKAYPYALIEAGHMGQNLQLAATEQGVGSCPIGGFVNDAVSETLDLTSDEIPLYVIALGYHETQANDNR